MGILLTLDPSVNNCGVAVFNTKKKELLGAELVHPAGSRKGDQAFYEKAFSLHKKVREIQEKLSVDDIVCELPDHWAIGGFQARESGSITKLSFLCGIFYGLKADVQTFVLVLPRRWKGQLSKEVMKNRIAKYYAGKGKAYSLKEWEALDHNIVDAIGLGHWRLYGKV